MKNYFNYKSFFSNFQISKIIKESKISLKCHYLKYFIYFSLNKIFQFGLFLMTKLSIIMIYCSKVVVLFFGFWILPIIRVVKRTIFIRHNYFAKSLQSIFLWLQVSKWLLCNLIHVLLLKNFVVVILHTYIVVK